MAAYAYLFPWHPAKQDWVPGASGPRSPGPYIQCVSQVQRVARERMSGMFCHGKGEERRAAGRRLMGLDNNIRGEDAQSPFNAAISQCLAAVPQCVPATCLHPPSLDSLLSRTSAEQTNEFTAASRDRYSSTPAAQQCPPPTVPSTTVSNALLFYIWRERSKLVVRW